MIGQAHAARASDFHFPLALQGPESERHREPPTDVLAFRDYRMFPAARRLERRGAAVELGSRAFDLLWTLIEQRGRVVAKAEIVKRVWPSTIVEESNLRFQMAYLRKCLGRDSDLIKTIPGRGYLFVDEQAVPRSTAAFAELGRRASEPDSAFEVAVIDNDSELRERLTAFLKHHDLAVRAFACAEEFLADEAAGGVRCVVVDPWLSGLNGLGLQRRVSAAGLPIAFVFVSSHADVHMAVQAMKAGACDFLTKPVRLNDLLAALRVAFAQSAGSVARLTSL